jgi:hypothetical protein
MERKSMSTRHYLKIMTIGVALATSGISLNLASAQDISDTHLKAARTAVDALKVTESFDNILPTAAERQKAALIQANPNFSDVIALTVDEEAIKLAGRRSDLETEAATIYAKNFSEEELAVIEEFYRSEAGVKRLSIGTNVGRELIRAADIWGSGIARDLDVSAGKALSVKLNPPSEEAAEKPAE